MTLISIIIPTRNEEAFLPRCLDSIKKSALHLDNKIQLEIVVILNRCTDNTEKIARDFGCIISTTEAKNLAIIRNTGIRSSSGEFCLTIDADSCMSENMLVEVVKNLSNQNIIGGGVMIWPERWSLGIILTGMLLLPYLILERIAGGLFFFRRTDFEAINGFDENWLSAEDIEFARRLKKYGEAQNKKFVTLQKAWIITSCRKFDRFGDWYFLKNPRIFLRLLKGRDERYANQVWYDFKR